MNSESSLKYPITDFITNIHNPVNQIKLEEQHFLFDDRYIDIIIKNNGIATHTFELKIAKYETTQKKEKKRIINDLLRLYFMNKIYNTESYFIMSGEHEQFMSFFRSISKTSGKYDISPTSASISDPIGFYTNWFRFSNSKDKLKKISLPNYIMTECVAITPIHSGAPLSHLVGIWKVY